MAKVKSRFGRQTPQHRIQSDLMTALPPTALARVAERFKLLSEVSRLQILCTLQSGPKNVNEIVEATQMGQANVSKHLKLLAQGGVLSRQQDGVSVYYQIADPTIFDLCEVVSQAIFAQVESESQQWHQIHQLDSTS